MEENYLIIDDTKYETGFTEKYTRKKNFVPKDIKKIYAFIPGEIIRIDVKSGDKVRLGDNLLILDAMKMKNELRSPLDGIIKAIHVNVGSRVSKSQLLVEFE